MIRQTNLVLTIDNLLAELLIRQMLEESISQTYPLYGVGGKRVLQENVSGGHIFLGNSVRGTYFLGNSVLPDRIYCPS